MKPLTTLPNLLKVFELFHYISNFKINFIKSHTLKVTLPTSTVSQCQQNFPFAWKQDAITYLGIQLPTRLSDLYSKNFLPVLCTVTEDLRKWNRPIFSWFGRVTIMKMTILPRLLYLLQAIPIRLLSPFFRPYTSLCTTFLWQYIQPRISYDQLTLPKQKGRIGLPDIHNYYRACHLSRIVNWNIHSRGKDWVTLEDLFSTLSIESIPWLLPWHLPPSLKGHPLIGPSLECFREANLKYSLSSIGGPMTPIRFNPDFPAEMSTKFLKGMTPKPFLCAHHFFHNDKVLDRSDLISQWSNAPIPQWSYMQVHHFLHSLDRSNAVSRPLTRAYVAIIHPNNMPSPPFMLLFFLNRPSILGKACSA